MEQTHTLQCLGFIMDGNRRWAKDQGLQTYEGHKKGGEVFADSIGWVREASIPHAVYYAFSTENWNRSEAEVSYLMDLFREWLSKIDERVEENRKSDKKINVRIVGQRADFDTDLQEQMNALEEKNAEFPHPTSTIWVALSYGGRAEIVNAVNTAIKNGEEVSEADFEKLLWTADMPDPDMIVRTSGEHRLSNFMTWRSVYSELHFIEKHWPALTQTDFNDILLEYENRERRRGK